MGEPWPNRSRQIRHIAVHDPRTRFGGGFGRRSAAAGARGPRSVPADLIDFAAKYLHEAIGNDSSRARTTCDARRTRTSYSAQTRASARRRLRGAHGGGGAKIWAPSSSYRWARAVEHSLALDPTCFYAASKSYVDGDGPKPTRSRAARGRRSRLYPRTFSLSTLQVHGFATPRAFRRWPGHLRRRRGVNNFFKTTSGTLRCLRDPKPEPAPRLFVPRGARVPASKLDREAPTRSSDYEVGAPPEMRLYALEHQIRERVKNVVVAGNF